MQQELGSLFGTCSDRRCLAVRYEDLSYRLRFALLLGYFATGQLHWCFALELLHLRFLGWHNAEQAGMAAWAVGERFLNGAFSVDFPNNSDRACWAWPTFLEVLFTRI